MSFGDWISLITLLIVVYQFSKDFRHNAEVFVSTHERDNHLVVCVRVMARDKVLRLKSLYVKGHQIALKSQIGLAIPMALINFIAYPFRSLNFSLIPCPSIAQSSLGKSREIGFSLLHPSQLAVGKSAS